MIKAAESRETSTIEQYQCGGIVRPFVGIKLNRQSDMLQC